MDTRIYAVDFETYYEKGYSLSGTAKHRALSYGEYTSHEKFDPYLVAIVGSDGYTYCGDPKEFDWTSIEGCMWISHNTAFDMAVWSEMVNRGWIEEAMPSEWHCTQDLCA